METGNEMKTISLSIAVAFLIGAVAAMLADPYLPASLSNTQKGYQAGFDAAKTLVASSSIGNFFQTPADVRMLSGTVTAISGDRVTFRVQPANPFDDPTLAERTAIADASTIITVQARKDQKTYQADISALVGTRITATGTAAALISPFVTTPASLSDIKVGTSINVSATGNIQSSGEFTASAIQIISPIRMSI